MNLFINPERSEWPALIRRPELNLDFLDGTVRNILARVKSGGDFALNQFTAQFDQVELKTIEVTADEFKQAEDRIPSELKSAIQTAVRNIEKFHQLQIQEAIKVDTMPGVTCWRKAIPLNRVGIYVPGGSAPLFSTVLMLAIPAILAGCNEVIMCTPPTADGSVNPAILYAAQVTGVTKVFKAGGAQAIAAMAYGTESIPGVDKVFGPGNQYVTKAKQLISLEGIAIDLPAGPSEVLVYADKTATPKFVAADLLSQAEHGTDSQVILVTTDEEVISSVEKEMNKQLHGLPRKEIAEGALRNSRALVFLKNSDALEFINQYAPEHLIINTEDAEQVADKIQNAGSVFIGDLTPEAVGDYASGTNHTLPTNGFARAFTGVSVDSFIKHITFQHLTATGIKAIGPVVETLAAAEGLEAHCQAVRIRLQTLSTI